MMFGGGVSSTDAPNRQLPLVVNVMKIIQLLILLAMRLPELGGGLLTRTNAELSLVSKVTSEHDNSTCLQRQVS